MRPKQAQRRFSASDGIKAPDSRKPRCGILNSKNSNRTAPTQTTFDRLARIFEALAGKHADLVEGDGSIKIRATNDHDINGGPLLRRNQNAMMPLADHAGLIDTDGLTFVNSLHRASSPGTAHAG